MSADPGFLGERRERVISCALAAMRSSYPQPVKVRETIPSMGGMRRRDIEILVARGRAAWVGDEEAVFVDG